MNENMRKRNEALAQTVIKGERFGPDDLRIGTKQNVFAPPFQLIAVAGCDDLVIFPLGIDLHYFFLTDNVILSSPMSHSFV